MPGKYINDFDLPDIFLTCPKKDIIYARKACIVHQGFKDLKTIFFSVKLHCLHSSGYLGLLL